MTRVLVLGAHGFLGSHVATAARSEPSVDEVLTPTRTELDLDAGVQPISQSLDRMAPDVVLMCTGRLDGTASELVAAHAGAVATLLDALGGLGRPVRLVRLGSAGEYGPVTWGESVRETHATWPVTAYGASHLAATHLLRAASLRGPVSGTTLRVFNPVGAGGHGPSLVGQVAARIRNAQVEGADEIVTAPLTTWRDLVDAEDVASAAIAAALVPGPPPAVVNIGSGRAIAVREVVTLLAELAGWRGTIREDGPAPSRSAGVGWMQADIALAAESLGWTPRRTLLDSLREIWADSHHQPAAATSASIASPHQKDAS
ncbi:NAD(P)-dependent oxidoreductase [Nostocoides sp. F2B08]|uniref:NAD-dependent epimerase/dehydratase family protein n=1 Tax=Nostocoides sp. F2B08 TaxID=2653936 RepID=UPI00186B56B4|nr:NAD(P)-dependent oxidoreductase [Tetrasphaera sp. F2B08]